MAMNRLDEKVYDGGDIVEWLDDGYVEDSERDALIKVHPPGFHIRSPPLPSQLSDNLTNDKDLFQTIHMGPAVVDVSKWQLIVAGLVIRPLKLNLSQLKNMPSKTVTSFQECYGSPLRPPIANLWRVGNIQWTGVLLRDILQLAISKNEASYIWSDGLEHGEFAGEKCDRYQKDLPMQKALSDQVLIAYAMNGQPLDKYRGGPVRLVVPGWYGTNSVKWLCKLTVADRRSDSLFCTKWYNEILPEDYQITDRPKRTRPCWGVEVNSMITSPKDKSCTGEYIRAANGCIEVRGWAWSEVPVEKVQIVMTLQGEDLKQETARRLPVFATVSPRIDCTWQSFLALVSSSTGTYKIMAIATDQNGRVQPASGRRNHSHTIEVEIVA